MDDFHCSISLDHLQLAGALELLLESDLESVRQQLDQIGTSRPSVRRKSIVLVRAVPHWTGTGDKFPVREPKRYPALPGVPHSDLI